MLLSHLRLCGDVPRVFRQTELLVGDTRFDKPIQRYNWADEESIDFALCRLAFDTSNEKLGNFANPSDFGAT